MSNTQNTQRYECEGQCDFWYVLHGNPMNVNYDEKLKYCQNCNKPQRLEAYKGFWDERSRQ